MSEVKSGGSRTFEIGGQKLIVEPIPFGTLKKLLKIVMEVMERGKAGDREVLSIPALLEHYGDQAIPLLFHKSKHPFLTKEWIDDNMTVPDLKEIIETTIKVNGLDSFFGKTATRSATEAVPPESAIPEIRPENTGSTISSGSATDGVREMSTK